MDGQTDVQLAMAVPYSAEHCAVKNEVNKFNF